MTATLVVDGAIGGGILLRPVGFHLVSALQLGDVVVLDNHSVSNIDGVREAVATAGGRVIYLPPCSSDRNPIDFVYLKLKWLLRAA